MLTIKRILVPVDFSSGSRAALDYALFLCRQLGGEIDLVHVWEPPAFALPTMLLVPEGETTRSLEEYVRQRATEQMSSLVASLDEEARKRVKGRLSVGDPVDTIVGLARNEGFDLIVMGTHGRRGLSRLVLGSVAERVLRAASCPVVTVRGSLPGAD